MQQIAGRREKSQAANDMTLLYMCYFFTKKSIILG